MENIFIDTNLFIRYILEDNEEQVDKVEALFKLAEEKRINLETNWFIIAEIEWILSSFYKFSKKQIFKALSKVLNLNFIKIDKKDLLIKATKIYVKKNVDLVDCLNYILAKDRKLKIASFDHDFDKLDKRIRYKF